MRARRSLVLALLLCLAPAAPLAAQEEAGAIAGTVVDLDGAPLPGVLVTLESDRTPPASAVTRANGVYRFPALPPGGSYSLAFELEGFRRYSQSGLRVHVGAVSQFDLTMGLAAVVENVAVTATTPVVDVRKTGIVNNVTEQYMQSIPSARDPWAMLEQTAGIQLPRSNIGGTGSGQAQQFTAGERTSDHMWTYDGTEITDMADTGWTSMYYDFDAFEEITISTAGNDPSIQVGGVRVNFVTRRGGNSWRGSGRYYITDGALQAHNVADPETYELTGNFSEDELYPGYVGNSVDRNQDWGIEFGGPLVRDRLFAWGAFGRQDLKINVGRIPQTTQLTNWHGKATYHAGQDVVLNYAFTHGNKEVDGRGAAPNRAPETTLDQEGPTPVHAVRLQYAVSDDLYAEAAFNYVGGGYQQYPKGGLDEQLHFDYKTGFAWGSWFYYETERPAYAARVDADAYVAQALGGDHEVRFGYSWRSHEARETYGYPGGAVAAFWAGYPLEAWLTSSPGYDHAKGVRNSVYVGDTFTAGRLTLNAGLRYDHQTSESLPSSTPGSPFSPEYFPPLEYPGFDSGHAWSTVSPRIGITYDLSGSGRTLLRANAARYFAQMGTGEFHEGFYTTGIREIDYYWSDGNGNGDVDPGETFGDPLWISSGWDPADPHAPPTLIFNPTRAPYTDELLVGVEHEVSRDLSVGIQGVYKKNDRENWVIRSGEDDDAFWEPVTQTVPGYGDITVYQPVDQRSQVDEYKERTGYNETNYRLELFMNKRFSDRWMANASVAFTESANHYDAPTAYTDPTNIAAEDGNPVVRCSGCGASQRTGTFWGAARWFVKASGMTQLPAGFNFAGFVQVRQGYINPQFVRSNNRPFGAGRTHVWVEPFGATTLETFWNIDLRVEKTLDVGNSGRIHLIADLFNATNNDIVLGRDSDLTSFNYDSISDVMQGRTLRLGARLVFR